jgi:hypothetical protein
MTDNLRGPFRPNSVALGERGLDSGLSSPFVSQNFRQNLKTPLTKAADAVIYQSRTTSRVGAGNSSRGR